MVNFGESVNAIWKKFQIINMNNNNNNNKDEHNNGTINYDDMYRFEGYGYFSLGIIGFAIFGETFYPVTCIRLS